MLKAGLALSLIALSLVACGKEDARTLTPLTGVGGNVYCVSDADERKLVGQAAGDPMASWILIHHYQRCEVDTNRAATLLKMQIDRDQKVMMDTLADFNARIELGRQATVSKPAK